MTIQTIRYDSLIASPKNVRTVKVGIEALAASIAAEGLLQNLVVVAQPDGRYEVIAGERRRRAIGQLIKSKIWAKDTVISCEVRDAENATTISLAENTQRVAMHPADAFRAFARLEKEGLDETAIANRYGYDPREVRRLLSLGNLSPKVLNALAADKIDVPTARAFTLTDDHKRQNSVLAKASSAHEVRRMLTETKVDTNSRQFKFVGADAYEAAGGTYTRDLFAAEGAGFADNAELLSDLVDQKFAILTEIAEAEGWGEVIAAPGQAPYESYQWHRIYPKEFRQLDDKATATLARLNAEIEARTEAMDEDFDPEDDEELAELDAQRSAIEDRAERIYSAEQKATGVLVITIDGTGAPSPTAYTKRLRSVTSDDAPKPPRALYDQRMTEELSQVRTAALQSEVAQNHELARCLLLDALLPMVASDGYTKPHAILLRATDRLKDTAVFDINTREILRPEHYVADLLAALPADDSERFAWLQTLDADALTRLQSYCTAALIDATTPKFAAPERIRSAERVARAASLDMTKHWDGGIEFWTRLSRKAMLAALTEAIGTDAAINCQKMPKMELAAACADRMPGRGWLPSALRLSETAAPALEAHSESVTDDDATPDSGDDTDRCQAAA